MRTILVLTCCLALTTAMRAEDQADKTKTKTTSKVVRKTAVTNTTGNTHVQGTHMHTNTLPAVQSNTTLQSNKLHTNTYKGQSNTGVQSNKWQSNKWQSNKIQSNTTLQSNTSNTGNWKNKNQNWSKTNQTGIQGNTHTFHTQQFHLKSGPSSGIASVKFQQNYHIQGSQNWKGQKYWAFKNYNSQWHDRNWWGSHHNRIILISGGYYYWDNGYYYPAWGYDSANEYYPYDGPIYSYNDMPLDQEIANVQTALQQEGYYQGDIDGMIGPQTRAALAQYQQDHGLEPTSAVDQPTVESLLGNS